MAEEHDDTAREESEQPAAAVRGPRSEAALIVLRGQNPGVLYTIDAEVAVIGRNPDVEVPVPDDTLSRRHARIVRAGKRYVIEDLGSTNGTFVDGARVKEPTTLTDGCRISLGARTMLHFALHDALEIDAIRKAQALTVRDPLTGAFNRRHLEQCLSSEAAFANRHAAELSLLLLDLDHFKQINDVHGHAVGDAALRLVAQELARTVRDEDVLARYGGEEFAVVVRGIDLVGTLVLAERMRVVISELALSTERGAVRLSVSIGVAHAAAGERADAQQLFEAADRALYAAKDAGRNRVETAETVATARPTRPAAK